MMYWTPLVVPDVDDAVAEDLSSTMHGGGRAQMCRLEQGTGAMAGCREALWGGNSFIRSASGVPLGEGRVLFFYTSYGNQGFSDMISVEDIALQDEVPAVSL